VYFNAINVTMKVLYQIIGSNLGIRQPQPSLNSYGSMSNCAHFQGKILRKYADVDKDFSE